MGAVIGVTRRIMKKSTQKVLKIDENSQKEMEDVQIIEDNIPPAALESTQGK